MRPLLTICLVVLALPAMAQEKFELRRVATAGDKAQYSLKVHTTYQGMDVKFAASILERVLSVSADGTIVSESSETDAKLSVDGEEMDAGGDSATETNTVTTDARGRTVLIEGPIVDDSSYRVAALNAVIWPESPVENGSKWTFEREASTKQGTPASSSEFEIVGLEDLQGVAAVKIRFKTRELTGDRPAESNGFHWVEKATGKVLRSEMDWKNAPVSGQIIDAKVVIELAE